MTDLIPMHIEHVLIGLTVGFGLLLVSTVVKITSTAKKLEDQTDLMAKHAELLIKIAEEISAIKVQLNVLLETHQKMSLATSESIKELLIVQKQIKEILIKLEQFINEVIQRELELREDNTKLHNQFADLLQTITKLRESFETLVLNMGKFVKGDDRNDKFNQ